MNHFSVIGVEQIRNLETIQSIDVPFVIVSIVSPEYPEYDIPYNSKCKDILYLRFHDTDNEKNVKGSIYEVEELKVISDNDIKQLLEFADKHKDITDWIVNCEAGMSRSAGVAMALSEIMNNTKTPHTYIQSNYPIKFHNVDVKLKILKYHKTKRL